MILTSSILVGILFAAGMFLMMRKNFFEVLLGTALLTHSINLFLITMSGWSDTTRPPIIEEGIKEASSYVDPLPQALILTAIVISFGVTSLLVVLSARAYEETQSMEVGELEKEQEEL